MFTNPKCGVLKMIWLKNKCNIHCDASCKELMEAIIKCEEKYH